MEKIFTTTELVQVQLHEHNFLCPMLQITLVEFADESERLEGHISTDLTVKQATLLASKLNDWVNRNS